MPVTFTRLARAIIAGALAAPALAQQVPVRDLPKPSKEIDDPFSLITAALEIKPGQVIVVDGTDLQVSLVDFAKGSRAPFGRQGTGPGEYRAPGGLFRLQGDTLWLFDAGQQRIVVFNPDLSPGTSIPMMTFDASTSTALTSPFFGDRRGRLYASAMTMRMGRGGGRMQMEIPDSVTLVRVDPRDPKARAELARVRFPTSGTPEMQQQGGNFKYTMAFPGLVASDPWAVFPDGRVAIVHGADYVVEFITPDGKHSAPVRVPWDRIAVTDADRKAEMDEAQVRMKEQSKAVQRMMPPNVSMTFELLPPASWPDHYPPAAPLGAIAGPDGRLWVKRATPIRVGREQWDVLDATGKPVARWRLPARTTIVAVGLGVVYAARTDEDDLRYVQRIDLPR